MKYSNILVLALALCLAGCTKEVVQTQGESLGIKDVSAAQGSFSIFVRTTGVWSVSGDATWLHVTSELFKDNSAVDISYDSNESTQGNLHFNRLGHVIVKTYDGARADTLTIRQKGIEPSIVFEESYSVGQGICYIPVFTNLGGAQRGMITMASTASWIHDISLGVDCTSICFTADSGSSRQAELSMSFTDEWGVTTTGSCIIKQ